MVSTGRWRFPLAAALGLAVGLLMAEVFLRLVPTALPKAIWLQVAAKPGINRRLGIYRYQEEYRRLWEPDELLRERIRPNVDTVIHGYPEYPEWPIRTSSLGLGPAGFPDDWSGEVPFALVLGDSFGFGVGLPEHEVWVQLLERATGREFVNLSQVGACSLQQARIWARYGRPLGARVVIWMFFQNDLKENLRFASWLEPQRDIPQAVRQPTRRCSGVPHRALERLSVTYELLLWWRRDCKYSAFLPAPHYRDQNLNLVFCRDHDICDSAVQNKMLSDGWPLTRRALLETAEQAAAAGSELIVLIVPSKEQVYREQLRLVAGDTGDPDRLVKPVDELTRERSLRCIDPLEDLRLAALSGRQLYFSEDIHWNAAGNAMIADVVERSLREFGLLP